jgi:hypothetical protein
MDAGWNPLTFQGATVLLPASDARLPYLRPWRASPGGTVTSQEVAERLARQRDRLRNRASGRPLNPVQIAPTTALGAVDVVVTPGELNDLHGTGFLVKRVFAGRRGILSLRIRNDFGGVHDFGDEAHRIEIDPTRRPEAYAAALGAVAGRTVRAVYSVPYTPADLLLAMAVSDVTRAPLCLWEMDDQCVAASGIPRPLMREFLGKCRLRLATHTELRDAYESTFGFRFGVLPAVVPARVVRPGIASRAAPGAPGALMGSVWSRAWLDQLSKVILGAGETLEWYGNHRAPWLRIGDRELVAMGLRPHGIVPEPELADALLQHPFVVVPTGEEPDGGREHDALAALSLPGRILFAVAAAQAPVLVVGHERTPAAAFVRRHGLGAVVPYDPAALRAAVAELRRPEIQAAVRARAATLAPGLSDTGVGDWLTRSVEAGAPADDRFERVFPREAASQEPR